MTPDTVVFSDLALDAQVYALRIFGQVRDAHQRAQALGLPIGNELEVRVRLSPGKAPRISLVIVGEGGRLSGVLHTVDVS